MNFKVKQTGGAVETLQVEQESAGINFIFLGQDGGELMRSRVTVAKFTKGLNFLKKDLGRVETKARILQVEGTPLPIALTLPPYYDTLNITCGDLAAEHQWCILSLENARLLVTFLNQIFAVAAEPVTDQPTFGLDAR